MAPSQAAGRPRAMRTRIVTNTWRDIEYHVDSGDLFLVGEKVHGFDFYDVESVAGRSVYWRCNMNRKDRGSGLLEFLFEHNLRASTMHDKARAAGFASFESMPGGHAFINLDPLPSVRVFVNRSSPAEGADIDSTTRPGTEDYSQRDSPDGIFFTLHSDGTGDGDALKQGTKGLVYMELCHASLGLAEGEGPGDGSSDRDNGIRADLAFRSNILLSPERKAELLERFECVAPLYGEHSKAYDFSPDKGL